MKKELTRLDKLGKLFFAPIVGDFGCIFSTHFNKIKAKKELTQKRKVIQFLPIIMTDNKKDWVIEKNHFAKNSPFHCNARSLYFKAFLNAYADCIITNVFFG